MKKRCAFPACDRLADCMFDQEILPGATRRHQLCIIHARHYSIVPYRWRTLLAFRRGEPEQLLLYECVGDVSGRAP